MCSGRRARFLASAATAPSKTALVQRPLIGLASWLVVLASLASRASPGDVVERPAAGGEPVHTYALSRALASDVDAAGGRSSHACGAASESVSATRNSPRAAGGTEDVDAGVWEEVYAGPFLRDGFPCDGCVAPNAKYLFRVRALHRPTGGSSRWSPAGAALTRPLPPRDLAVVSLARDAARLRWRAPRGGADRYVCEARAEGAPAGAGWTRLWTGRATEARLPMEAVGGGAKARGSGGRRVHVRVFGLNRENRASALGAGGVLALPSGGR